MRQNQMVRKNPSQEISRALNVFRNAYEVSTGKKDSFVLDDFLHNEIDKLDEFQKNMMNRMVLHEYGNDLSSLKKFFPLTLKELGLDANQNK